MTAGWLSGWRAHALGLLLELLRLLFLALSAVLRRAGLLLGGEASLDVIQLLLLVIRQQRGDLVVLLLVELLLLIENPGMDFPESWLSDRRSSP